MRLTCGLALFLAACCPARADEKTPPRYLSLAEARALALEQMKAVSGLRVLAIRAPRGPGTLVVVPGRGQARAEIERQVSQTLLNVETAYWNLYGAYWNLFSREQGLRFARAAYDQAKINHDAGRVKAAEFYQARGQYELYRAQRLGAGHTIMVNEQDLRALVGLPARDGRRLVPSDAPTLAELKPDWDRSLRMALSNRPEVQLARGDVLIGQVQLALAQALARNDWPLMNRVLRMSPRLARADERRAALRLNRSCEVLRDREAKAERFLALAYARLPSFAEQIKAQQAQREAFGEQLRAREQEYLAGRGAMDVLLESQRFWADSTANEFQAIVSYNNTLTDFEFARGNLLHHDGVSLAASLPDGTRVRAVERERRRALELVRATPALPPDSRINPMWKAPKAGPAPATAPALPALLKRMPLLSDAATPSLKE
jgi:hypothetical protein